MKGGKQGAGEISKGGADSHREGRELCVCVKWNKTSKKVNQKMEELKKLSYITQEVEKMTNSTP